MAGEDITVRASDGSGSFKACLSPPADGRPGPGVIMCHEIFGVTPWIRETADLFSAHGYCVVAPDMFWRMRPEFVGDHTSAEDTAEGRDYKARIDYSKAMEDLQACMELLKARGDCNGKVAITGFCTGGTLAYLAASRLDLDAAAPYYGTNIHNFYDEGRKIKCPTILHHGDADDRVPADLTQRLTEAIADVPHAEVLVYDAGHAFANSHRPEDYYVEAAAKLAHQRTFELFDRLR